MKTHLESARLCFERFTSNDFEKYFTLVSNLDSMRMITGEAIPREEAIKKYDKVMAINEVKPEIGYFIVTNKSTNAFMGLGKIVLVEKGEAEIGYSILPQYWRQGYGYEISAHLVAYTKTISYIDKLMAIINPQNTASRRILEKCDFTFSETGEYEGMHAAYFRLPLST